MYELVILLLGALRGVLHTRGDVVIENLLLRHRLAVVTRPGCKRPPLRISDKLLWVLARRFCAHRRRHLVPVRPGTVVRRHRRARKLFWRERLDHMIVVDDRHPSSVLRAFVGYDNADRPHRRVGPETPRPAARPEAGPVRSRPVLGGLHHV